jgi:hypothetical protein
MTRLIVRGDIIYENYNLQTHIETWNKLHYHPSHVEFEAENYRASLFILFACFHSNSRFTVSKIRM